MAKVQIKLLECIASETYSYKPGSIIEVEEASAKAMVSAGTAIIAPGSEVAANQIQSLTNALNTAQGERDTLKTGKLDLEGKLAAALATNKGVMAEMAVHKKAAADALANVSALSKQVADLTQERDQLQTQAKAAGDELAAYIASIQAGQTTAQSTPAAKK